MTLKQKKAITFCLLHCGSDGLPTSAIRTTFGGTRTEKLSQSATTTNNLPLAVILENPIANLNYGKIKSNN